MCASNQPTKSSFIELATRLPLLWVSLSFLLGILLASQAALPFLVWLILAGVVIILTVLVRIYVFRAGLHFFHLPPSTLFLVLLNLAVLFLGAVRYQATTPEIDAFHIAWYKDRLYEVLVTGTLMEPPDERDTYANLRLEVEAIDTGDGNLPVHGLILARVDPGQELHYGDRIRLRGLLKTPPENEDFSYRDYLARQGVYAYMTSADATLLPGWRGNVILRLVYALKAQALNHIYQIFPDPEASLLAGILLGVDTGLPKDLQQAFKDTGTAHIIAISGFNIAIIAGLFVTIFNRFLGPRRGAVAAVIGIAAYTLLVGADASVVRAAIMGSLALFARQIGRRQTAINTLTVTAAAMALINPHTLWDVGFQLSFAATLGLILYAQPLQAWAERQLIRFMRHPIKKPTTRKSKAIRPIAPDAQRIAQIARLLSECVFFTLAAQLTTLPIMAYHFQRVSLVALIANPFILPVQPPVMILSGLAVLLSLIYLPLGQIAAWLAWPFSVYTIRAVEFFDLLPHGVLVLGDFSFLLVFLFYAALFAVTFMREKVVKVFHLAAKPSVTFASLGLLTFLVWRAAFAAPDGRLHLTFLDVGSGEAVLIQTPSGASVLINGGQYPSRLSNGLGRRLPLFDRHIDWLVVASTQENQVGALPRTLERFPPDEILWAGLMESSYPARQIDEWLAENNVPVERALPGAGLDLGQGAALSVLTTGARGAVLLVEWGGFRALLPLGANFNSLAELANGATVSPVTVLLLADSGYAPLNPPEWIDNLHPQVVILSVTAGDANGLPDQSVLDTLQGYNLLRSDRNGWIEVTTDGEKMWLEVQRK